MTTTRTTSTGKMHRVTCRGQAFIDLPVTVCVCGASRDGHFKMLSVLDDEDDDLDDDEDEHEVIYGRPDLSKRADQLL